MLIDRASALRETAAELKQLHAHHYGQCEGGCPAEACIKRAEAVLAIFEATKGM